MGFIHGLKPEEIRDISCGLTYKYEHQGARELWEDQMSVYSKVVRQKIDEYWRRLVEEKKLDVIRQAFEASKAKAERRIDVDTLKHTDARDIGAEWLCFQAIRQLKFDRFLRSLGWSEEQVKLAVGHLIVRTIYTPSELKSMRIMRDNSGICELLDLAIGSVTQRKVYSVADRFLKEKVKIEKYLCQTTDELFRPTNRIMLFDLTNFYFEGRKDGSRKARFGRSKEKRSDCKLLVLALCINTEGFIRYSAILEGNTADPKSLPDMVDRLIATNPTGAADDQKVLVVIDAGIASKDNLDLIKQKGYNYLCVSRKALTDYEVKPDARTVTVKDNKEQPIRLQEVRDYYNLIREIECSNRQLKTDLSLRPIYHQKDDRSDAHLFLGLLSYWIVNACLCKHLHKTAYVKSCIMPSFATNDNNCYWESKRCA